MVISNDKLRARFRDEISRIGEHNPNAFFNAALISAYTECDQYITDLKVYLDECERVFRSRFAELFPKCHIAKREGSYLLWIDLSAYFKTEEELKEFFIDKARVAIYLGSQFSPDYKLFIRFNLASPLSVLEEALKRMDNVLQGRAYNASK